MRIKGCIALVTGANCGLGSSFVEALLAAGAAKVYAGDSPRLGHNGPRASRSRGNAVRRRKSADQ
jgi:NAD(P)-dependent dehydrogenase (short-subunit alcohol dehydrogenase family)